ncbi:MAG TPA: hypothetical protein VLW50_26350 [Streptosporangiaceae bacterium]|nr:hypothetical protein [Streptosporangiaceae bacterium]
MAHAFWNTADELARTVEVVVPAGFEAFFEELAQASATGDPRQVQQRRADLAAKYRLDYLTEPVPDLKAKYGLKLIGEKRPSGRPAKSDLKPSPPRKARMGPATLSIRWN